MAYVERLSATRTEEVKKEWPDVRRALLTSIEEAGDGASVQVAESIGTHQTVKLRELDRGD